MNLREQVEYTLALALDRWDNDDIPDEARDNNWTLSEFLADQLGYAGVLRQERQSVHRANAAEASA